MVTRRRVALPDFPWDKLLPARAVAAAHADGVVDLSIGTPVDETPEVVQQALRSAANAPGYPTTHGTPAFREAAVGWLQRRFAIDGLTPEAVLPTLGSKEVVAWLPTMLGLGVGDVIAFPALAYPTYEVGARIAGATPVAVGSLTEIGPRSVSMMWVNSPANPHGQVLPVEHLRKVVSWARERGVIVVSDECYLEFAWDIEAVSILDPRVSDGQFDGLLAVHSLSKRSNLAGYRAGFITGDPQLVGELLELRKHAGMLLSSPVQAAAIAALSDDEHVDQQRDRYLRRRSILQPALEAAGFTIEHSQGSLYLWATRGESCWTTINWLAEHGIVAAPGDFYGRAGGNFVRIALTATDERVAAAVSRLTDALRS